MLYQFAMRFLIACVFVLSTVGCKSAGEKKCLEGKIDEPHIASACGEACDQGNQEACVKQTKIGDERCFKAKDAETCRWMCLYGKSGKDLYCAEHEKITGKPVE